MAPNEPVPHAHVVLSSEAFDASPATQSQITLFSFIFQVAELREKINKTLARLKQQQNLYEAVRTDRNIHSKNLIETQVSSAFSKHMKSETNPVTITRKTLIIVEMKHGGFPCSHQQGYSINLRPIVSVLFAWFGAQDLIKGMKRRFKIMNNQIDQLKDEISAMDNSLVRRSVVSSIGKQRRVVSPSRVFALSPCTKVSSLSST